MKTAFIFLANGFEEIEAVGIIDLLRRAGVEISIVSIEDTIVVTGAHDIAIEADLHINDISASDIDALILPGGMPGSDNLNRCEPLKKMLSDHHKKGKLIAAICAAPLVFGELGLLNGLRATCYPSFEPRLTGAILTDEPAVVDGNVITGKSPGSVFNFALAIVEYLKGPDKASDTKAALYLPD
jgi:4-methyl-5(b-hydroxyethyl)-thiazole monophosphate biosynthesis